MASITSLMNSNYNTSSIYGNRNILSGLASGMDTETMIENAVSGIKRKIQSLYQKRTKVEWQQEAYRSIIDKAVNFNTKYTSYSSKTNLLSGSFFNNAVITTAKGTYADKVSATGKSSSNIKINAVKQLATSSSYTVSGMGGLSGEDYATITGKEFDIAGQMDVSNVAGMLTFQYGGSNGTSFTIDFGELENVDEVTVYNADGTVKEDATNAEKMAQAIKNKLSEITYTYKKSGYQETTTADKAIKVNVGEDGEITFSDGLGNGNKVSISSASGSIVWQLGISADDTSITVPDSAELTGKEDTWKYLADKSLTINFNGTSKTISMANVMLNENGGTGSNEDFVRGLQDEINKAFGADKIDVAVSDDGKLSFSPRVKDQGNTLSLSGTAIEALGFQNGDSNYINAGKKLSDILGDKSSSFFTEANRLKSSSVNQKTNAAGVYYVDKQGNRVDKDGYRITDTGEYIYNFSINGAQINVTEDTTLESLMSSINSNTNAGVKVSYSTLTNEFKFTTNETGASSKIEFGGLAKELFNPSSGISSSDKFSDAYDLNLQDGEKKWIHFYANGKEFTSFSIGERGLVSGDASIEDIIREINDNPMRYTASYDEQTGRIAVTDRNGNEMELTVSISSDMGGTQDAENVESKFTGGVYTAGQDAIMDVEINGVRFEEMTRSSNNFDIDGMNITVKDTFEAAGKDGEKYEPITFETVTDSDKIIDAIRDFVNDYNEMVTELKGAYSTMPAQQTNGSRYDPLTAEQEEGMSESEIASYNEKAKQGLLFGDTTLSSMYGKLLNAIAPGGADGQTLREIGINTSYENGLTTLSLDEDKLRAALNGDPEKVKTAFTKTTESGSATDGLMQTLQNTLNTYVKTTGEPKGVLITKAGSIKSPTTLNSNSLSSQISSIDKQIERWTNKMSKQIDRYTTQFSKLEQLIAEMNSQASALSGLMGGYEGY